MEIKISKFQAGDYYTIKYLQELNDDGDFTQVERTDKYTSLIHNDLQECVSKILNFYNSIISKEYKEEISKANVFEYKGRVLASRILKTWNEDFVDEDTGDIVSIERNEITLDTGEILDDDSISEILESTTESFFIYKQNYQPEEISEPLFIGFKSIELFYEKGNDEIKSFRLELFLRDKCPLMHENKCTTKTSKIHLNRTYKSVFHIEIQQKFIELINALNVELLEYMKGKNGLPEQTKLF